MTSVGLALRTFLSAAFDVFAGFVDLLILILLDLAVESLVRSMGVYTWATNRCASKVCVIIHADSSSQLCIGTAQLFHGVASAGYWDPTTSRSMRRDQASRAMVGRFGLTCGPDSAFTTPSCGDPDGYSSEHAATEAEGGK
jgi:hypothetical protein